MHRRPRLRAWPREIHPSYIDQKQEGEGKRNCKLKCGGEKTGSQAVDMSLHVQFFLFIFCLNHQNFFFLSLSTYLPRTHSLSAGVWWSHEKQFHGRWPESPQNLQPYDTELSCRSAAHTHTQTHTYGHAHTLGNSFGCGLPRGTWRYRCQHAQWPRRFDNALVSSRSYTEQQAAKQWRR